MDVILYAITAFISGLVLILLCFKPGYLLGFSIAYFHLLFENFWKKKRFDLYDFTAVGEPHKNGFFVPKDEWRLDSPLKVSTLKTDNDEAFVFGTNSKSECLAFHLSRLPYHKVECSLFLRMSNGRLYTLPEEHRIQRSTSEDNTFGSARFKLQCLIPMRKWRIFFNGILKEKCNKTSASPAGEKHVKLSFIWTASSEIFDFSSDLSKTLISHTAALSSTLWKKSITCLLKRIKDVFNAYEQPGMLLGTITIGNDPEKEIYLWGARRRYMGKKISESFEFLKIYGNFKNGSILHIGLVRIHQYFEQLPYGYLMKANGFIFPIEDILSDLAANENEEMVFKFCADNKWHELKLKRSGSPSTFQDYHGRTSVFTVDMNLDGREGSGFVFEGDGDSRGIPEPLPNWDEHKENYETKSLPSYCIPFNDELFMKLELCGGKGASLGNLHLLCLKKIDNASSLKFRVSKGFVISTDAYATFINGQLEEFLQTTFEKDVWSKKGETQSLCQKAQDMIINAELPEKVVQSISETIDGVFGNCLNDCTFAIRSSATGEDTEQMSAAGQMETFLGVKGLDQILQAVKNCWASQFSFRAVEYKRGYGQPLNNLMAVVIQEMVACEAAGVVFTCNPVTGNPSSIHITANWGLGESVVSASSDPDTITLDRNLNDELRIACKQIGKKSTKILMDGNSGIRETEATISERSVYCISDEMALKLGRIAVQIENCSGAPRDIEWGTKDGEIFLFQSRPVTTLDTDTDFEIKHMFDTYQRMEKSFWTKANVGEVMPGVSSPLCIEVLQRISDVAREGRLINITNSLCPHAPYYQKNLVYAFNHTFMNLVGGFLSYDKEHQQMTNSFMIALFGRLIDMEDMRAQSADITRQPVSRIKGAIIALYFLMMCFFSGLYVKIRSKKIKSIHIPCEGMNASELLQRIGQNFEVGAEGISCHMNCTITSSFWNMSMLSLLAKIRGDWDNAVFSDFAQLLSTCNEVKSADVPAAVQELGATIAKEINPDLFKKMDPEDALFWLNNNSFEAGKQFKQFLSRHGHRCLKEFDVHTETWGSNPIPLIKMLQNFVNEKTVKPRNKKISSFSSIESKLNVQLNFKNRLYLRWLLPNVRRAVSDRERAKSLSIFTINTLRKPFHRLAEIMVEEGRLPGKEFLFFLSIEEIDQLIRTRSPRLVSKAIRRCKASKEMDKMMFPEICTGIPKPINAEDEETVTTGNGFKMTGVPVSQGIVKAPARVVMNLEEASKIQQGDIIITYSTDIGWSPYFPLLSGVVTELGGLISHGAVIAREYGLPCVVSLHGATKAFKSGDMVILDGSKGTLQKVEE